MSSRRRALEGAALAALLCLVSGCGLGVDFGLLEPYPTESTFLSWCDNSRSALERRQGRLMDACRDTSRSTRELNACINQAEAAEIAEALAELEGCAERPTVWRHDLSARAGVSIVEVAPGDSPPSSGLGSHVGARYALTTTRHTALVLGGFADFVEAGSTPLTFLSARLTLESRFNGFFVGGGWSPWFSSDDLESFREPSFFGGPQQDTAPKRPGFVAGGYTLGLGYAVSLGGSWVLAAAVDGSLLDVPGEGIVTLASGSLQVQWGIY